jgi:hypothetical protein
MQPSVSYGVGSRGEVLRSGKYLFVDVTDVVPSLGQHHFVSGLYRKIRRFSSPVRSYGSTHTLSIPARALGKEWET